MPSAPYRAVLRLERRLFDAHVLADEIRTFESNALVAIAHKPQATANPIATFSEEVILADVSERLLDRATARDDAYHPRALRQPDLRDARQAALNVQ